MWGVCAGRVREWGACVCVWRGRTEFVDGGEAADEEAHGDEEEWVCEAVEEG